MCAHTGQSVNRLANNVALGIALQTVVIHRGVEYITEPINGTIDGSAAAEAGTVIRFHLIHADLLSQLNIKRLVPRFACNVIDDAAGRTIAINRRGAFNHLNTLQRSRVNGADIQGAVSQRR